MFRFNSIEHAILLSKYLHFGKCGREESLKSLKEGFKLTDEEEQNWDIFKYSVCLNATYFKIMERDHLKKKLLDTGDEYLVYKSDDEWGGDENLFGRALMEIRDEIRRLYKNEDKIDWEYTEYLKYKPW
ncbi:MAG: NADAR family protein [Methanobrevibacter sp.]|nr:NADAR family protein [Methanobrevibacter sp.]